MGINTRAQRAALRRLSERANALSERPNSSQKAHLGHQLTDHLRACGIPLSPGLSESEFQRIESVYGFAFPADLRTLLSACVPSGPGFPDWRSLPPYTLLRWINLPLSEISDRTAQYRPVLIPVFGFFFLPASPCRAGNPIFLVRDEIVVCCGGDIWEFFRKAFVGCESQEEHEEEQVEFPFRIDHEEKRRWSMSGMNSQEDHHWGRNIDSLARCSVEVLKKNVSMRRSSFNIESLGYMEIGESRGSMRLDRIVMRNLSKQKQVLNSPSGPRRIEFWSDLAEKMMHNPHKRIDLSMCLSGTHSGSPSLRSDSGSSRHSSSFSGDCVGNSGNKGDSKWVYSFLSDVAARLRSAGWEENDIIEMFDGSSPKSVLQQGKQSDSEDEQSVSKCTSFSSLDSSRLSKCLTLAGFTVQEVSDIINQTVSDCSARE